MLREQGASRVGAGVESLSVAKRGLNQTSRRGPSVVGTDCCEIDHIITRHSGRPEGGRERGAKVSSDGQIGIGISQLPQNTDLR